MRIVGAWATGADHLRRRRARFFCMCTQHGRCRKMLLVKLREREKYDTAPAVQQRNKLSKKIKARRSRALTNVCFCQFTSRAWRTPPQRPLDRFGDYFASFAIWCVRRDTFRLALFL